MADEQPSSNNPQDDDSTKKETIRITLPPKGDAPAVKRETVRINVPGAQSQPLSSIPKKETSKITLPSPSGIVPPPAPTPLSQQPAPKISGITPPPSPLGVPTTRPLSGSVPPPKPPPLTGKPTVPLRPAPPSGISAPPLAAQASGITPKPASPKKETARITLPGDAPKSGAPALPKATVKMQQTQPLSKGPTSGVRPQTSQVTVASSTDSSPAKADVGTLVLSLVAAVAGVVAAVFAYMVNNAAQLQDWATKL